MSHIICTPKQISATTAATMYHELLATSLSDTPLLSTHLSNPPYQVFLYLSFN